MTESLNLERRGLLFVISSPSGAGKTTISREVLEKDEDISLSISVTTRQKRPGEEDGVHYHFRTKEEFDRLVEEGEFLEYAKVFDNWYGTLKRPVVKGLDAGKDVLFDIDWQGTQHLKETLESDLVTVFILPPSKKELEERLHKREQDSEEIIRSRMAKANSEISHYTEYTYIVVNKDLETSVDKVLSILKAERLKRRRLTGLNNFVRQLTSYEEE